MQVDRITDEPTNATGTPEVRWAARLRALLKRFRDAAPASLRAARTLVWRLAVHPRQAVGEAAAYLELSVGYLAKAAGVSRGTASAVWRAAAPVVGWIEVGIDRIRAMGLRLRDRRGGRWGRHLVAHAGALEAAESVTTELGLGPERRADPPEGWRTLRPVRRGRHLVCSCPWHDDRNPSMLVNANRDDGGASGWAVCMRCRDDQGRRLSVYWRRTDDGTIKARPAAGIRRSDREDRALTQYITPEGGGRAGGYVLGALNPDRGLRTSRSSAGSILRILRWAERSGPASRREAWRAAMEGQRLPDRLVSSSEMRPQAWRTLRLRGGREVRIPDRWGASRQRWALVDLDDFEPRPALPDTTVRAALERIRLVATSEGCLSGRAALIQTSPTGLQAWLELDGPRGPDAFRSMRDRVARIADRVLKAVRAEGWRGGRVDPSAHAPGRYGRRPGWRLIAGCPFRARLLGTVDGSPGGTRAVYLDREEPCRTSPCESATRSTGSATKSNSPATGRASGWNASRARA